MVVVNREHGGKEKLEKLGYQVHALAKITEIVDSLYREKSISDDQADKVLDYVKTFNLAKIPGFNFFSTLLDNHCLKVLL